MQLKNLSSKAKKRIALVLALLLATVGVLIGLGNFYTDFLWFEHLGFGDVFTTVFMSQVWIGAGFGLFALGFFGVHVALIRKFSAPRTDWTFPNAAGELVDLKDVVAKVATPVVLLAGLAAASVMGYLASRHWEDVLKFLHQTSFGETDPILHRDIGFYMFVLPTLEFVQEWMVYLTGGGLALCAAVYVARGAVTVKERHLEMSPRVQGHLLFGLACVLAVLAWGWRVEMFETMFSKRGAVYGASYTDVYVNLIAYRIMLVVCVLAALYMIALIFTKPTGKRATRLPAYTLGVVVVLWAGMIFGWAWVVQKFAVMPSELEKEEPYLVHEIAGTRKAYGLDQIETKQFPANEGLTVADLEKNRDTIDNVKIWDHRPLKRTYKQLQRLRWYFDFPTVSEDRYRVGDHYYQVMLSPRELSMRQHRKQDPGWVNEHLKYTHGYGICMSPVSAVEQEGLPALWVKDIPPVSTYPEMKITRPEIYFGQVTDDYVLVKTTEQELDYPQEGLDTAATTPAKSYAGKGGVNIGTFFRKLLFAIRMGDHKLFFTEHLRPDSRILFNRNIQYRVDSVAPFLMLDQEPYMTIVDGRLLWIQDAYTVSYRYPYSKNTPLGKRERINYIRNSVKAVVDAYDGTMTLYIWDAKDPMVQTYAKIFPSLFRPKSEMPQTIKQHLRYPKDLFMVQAMMYERYHMTDTKRFYANVDQWIVSRELKRKSMENTNEAAPTPGPNAAEATDTDRMAPNFMIMKLPEAKREEFMLMLPYTMRSRDNMVAWLSARCDGDDYGKLLLYEFPKSKNIFGPMQIEARIDQNEAISGWITLRDRSGSQVIRGDLLVIPIENSILYVEPVYLQAKQKEQARQTQLPELKQVIVSYGKNLTMKKTLREALYDVFGATAPEVAQATRTPSTKGAATTDSSATEDVAGAAPPNPPSATAAATNGDTVTLVTRARQHYDAAQAKAGQGNWAGFGEEQKKLKATLDALAASLEGRLTPRVGQTTPSPVKTPDPARAATPISPR